MNKGITIGITILFIITSLTPMVIGYKAESTVTELDKMLDNLRIVCTDARGFSEEKYEYYKEQLLMDNSNDDIVIEPEKEESTIPIEPSPTAITGGPMDSAWSMKCYDTRHTSQSPYSTADNPYTEKWRFPFSGWLDDSPIIDSDGTIYCKGAYNSLDRYLYAIYPDGTEKWKYKTDGLILGSSPALADDGTIYIGSWDDYLHAINPDGTRKWRFLAHDNIGSSPAIADDGTIYFGTMGTGYNIYAVNPDGTEKWHYKTGYVITSCPAIGDDGTVYIGSQDNYLYAMWPNGTLRWRFGTGSMIMGPPSIADDGTIYIASWDDYLYALYPNGTKKWKHQIGVGAAMNPSIASDGTIYVGHDALYAVNPDGSRKWKFPFGSDRFNYASSYAISADGTIYFGVDGNSYGGEFIAVNPDGTEKWRKKIADKWVKSSPSIAEDGTVYIGSACDMGRGYLHAFGNVESNSPPGAPSISGPTNGKAREDYWYTFVAHDPDNNPIQLFVDWGDGNSGWAHWFASGETMWAQHKWTEQGTYTIKAKVKDVMGEESDWTELVVTMPRNKAISSSWFLQFLEKFPLLEKLLFQI